MEAERPKPADDWPAETWLRIQVEPGDTPAAIRMRHWLKAGLRAYGIVAVELTGKEPDATPPGETVGQRLVNVKVDGVRLIGGRNAAITNRALAAGFYAPIIPIVVRLRGQGLSLCGIARKLERWGVRTRRGLQRWDGTQVRRMLARAPVALNDRTGG